MKTNEIKFENNTVYLSGPGEISHYFPHHSAPGALILDALSHDFTTRSTGVPFDLGERMDYVRSILRSQFNIKKKPDHIGPRMRCPNPGCASFDKPEEQDEEPDVDAIVLEMHPTLWQNYLRMVTDYHRSVEPKKSFATDPYMLLDNKFNSILQPDNKTEHAYGKYLSYWDIHFEGDVHKTYIIWRFKDVNEFGAIRKAQITYWKVILNKLIQDVKNWGVGHDLQIPLADFGEMYSTLKMNIDFYNDHLRHLNFGYPIVYTLKADGEKPGYIPVTLRITKPEQQKEQTK